MIFVGSNKHPDIRFTLTKRANLVIFISLTTPRSTPPIGEIPMLEEYVTSGDYKVPVKLIQSFINCEYGNVINTQPNSEKNPRSLFSV